MAKPNGVSPLTSSSNGRSPTAVTADLTRQRLALQILGATVKVDDAFRAAAKLEVQLEPPSILEHVSPDADVGPLLKNSLKVEFNIK